MRWRAVDSGQQAADSRGMRRVMTTFLVCALVLAALPIPAQAQGSAGSSASVTRLSRRTLLRRVRAPRRAPVPAIPSTTGETVRRGYLRIEEISVPDDDVVPGQRGKVLMRFRATAGRQDVALIGLTLRADTGSIRNLSNLRVLRGDAVVSPSGRIRGSVGIIDRINVVLPVLETAEFAVIGDVAPGAADGAISLAFATENAVLAMGDIDGRELTGISIDNGGCGGAICWIEIWTAQ
ncbi:MAG: hypothetical protein G01um101425_371 [Candidatus Peregrinibacteria bacterium Gr01-1014_25]|nr:MAG: hypothetical protein G01um101425_371 [Candidatus Peregrinibacteria bacterium Gr01-1014_25]